MFALISNDYERWMISDNVVNETYYSHWAKNKNPWETHGKPTNPCCGYGFMVGSETMTHTHTHGTHTHNPHGFWNPLQSLPSCHALGHNLPTLFWTWATRGSYCPRFFLPSTLLHREWLPVAEELLGGGRLSGRLETEWVWQHWTRGGGTSGSRSRYALRETCLSIGKGPSLRWESFRDGRVVWIFGFTQSCLCFLYRNFHPIRKFISWLQLWRLLWFETHPWMLSAIKHEGCLLGGGVYMVIILELRHW